jgi:hypothetical protein
MVSGVAALIKSAWPHLTARQIADIMFTTAIDLGAPGVDEVYGRGLVNAYRAVLPIGLPQVVTQSGRVASAQTLGLIAPAASGPALRAIPLKLVAKDDYGRGFQLDLSSAIRIQGPTQSARPLAVSDRQTRLRQRSLTDGSQLLFAVEDAPAREASLGDNLPASRLGGFSLVSSPQSGLQWAVGGNGQADHFFGGGHGLAENTDILPSLANPAFALVPGHGHVGMGLRLDQGWTVKGGVLNSATADIFARQSVAEPSRPRASAWVAGLAYNSESHAMGVTMGRLTERDALLGARGESLLEFDGNARSLFTHVDAVGKLGDGMSVFASYTWVNTPASQTSGAGLVSGHGALKAEAFSLGLGLDDAMRSGDRLKFTLSQPLRLRSGTLNLMIPEFQDQDGSLAYGAVSLGMAPVGREIRSELSYGLPLSGKEEVSASLMHRSEPGHDQAQPDDVSLSLKWSKWF